MKKNKLNMFFVFIFILLIIGNIYFNIKKTGYSGSPKDNNLQKLSSKYIKETDEYKFGIIHNSIDKIFVYTNDSNIDGLFGILDSEYIKKEDLTQNDIVQHFKDISNFSVEDAYKFEKQEGAIYYTNVLIEENKKLKNLYMIVKLDYNNQTFLIDFTDIQTYEKAVANKLDKIDNFSIVKNEYNEYEYIYDIGEICYRYINNYYLKYNYKPKEAYSLILNKYKNYDEYLNKRVKANKIELDDILYLDKEINKKNILYKVMTYNNEYEIEVSSAMQYKIKIK